MRKFQSVFNLVAAIRGAARGDNTKVIKKAIGDSTRNNRTLTVNQVVRYLTLAGFDTDAQKISVVTEILKDQILSRRNNRTDSIDINELVTTYRTVVMTDVS